MTDEERRAKAAENKRSYRLRKKQEDLARQAPKEEQERLFNEQFRNLSPEEIEATKRDEQARMQDFRRIAQADPTELAERLMAARLPDKGNIPRTLWHILHELTLIRARGERG